MKRVSIFLIIILIGLFAACSKQQASGSEPTPPNPFPVELSAQLRVFSVDVDSQTVTNKLVITVNRNTEYYKNVTLQYKVLYYKDGKYEELTEKMILNENIKKYEKTEKIEDIILTNYGQYRVEIEANYGSFGQQKSFTLDFDKNGISVTPNN
jgi:hypothetical protein